MRLIAITLLAATAASAARAMYGAQGPARAARDVELTSYRGQDRVGEYTLTAYAGGIIEFVRDQLHLDARPAESVGEGVRMTNAERLKKGLKVAKPEKMKRGSGGDRPTRGKYFFRDWCLMGDGHHSAVSSNWLMSSPTGKTRRCHQFPDDLPGLGRRTQRHAALRHVDLYHRRAVHVLDSEVVARLQLALRYGLRHDHLRLEHRTLLLLCLVLPYFVDA